MDDMKHAMSFPDYDNIIGSIIIDNPDKVKAALENEKLQGWFLGQVMKETKGTVNPTIVQNKISEVFKFLKENGYGN